MRGKNSLELIALTKRYGDTVAVDGINHLFAPESYVCLLGPSGCGKSSTLRMIAGHETVTEGAIVLDGQDIAGLVPAKRGTAMMFQSYALFPHLSVAENIGFGLQMLGKPKAEVAATTARMLAMVRMEALASRKTSQLSGGQQQRVALARALAPQPKVLLLDEPLSALDLKLRKEMQTELKRLQQETGITFIFVTHDQEEALTMSDRIGVMSAGHILQIGTPRQIYTRPATRFVASFIGETNFLTGTLRGTVVALDAGGQVRITDPGKANGPVTLAVRPEHVRIVPENTAGSLRATLTAQVYFGTDTHCHLTIGDTEVIARLQSNPGGDPGLAVGTRVGLAFAPDALQVLGD